MAVGGGLARQLCVASKDCKKLLASLTPAAANPRFSDYLRAEQKFGRASTHSFPSLLSLHSIHSFIHSFIHSYGRGNNGFQTSLASSLHYEPLILPTMSRPELDSRTTSIPPNPNPPNTKHQQQLRAESSSSTSAIAYKSPAPPHLASPRSQHKHQRRLSCRRGLQYPLRDTLTRQSPPRKRHVLNCLVQNEPGVPLPHLGNLGCARLQHRQSRRL